MKQTNLNKKPNTNVLNVMSLGALLLTWAHIMGLISIWLLPLTILMYLIGYGSEIHPENYK